MAETPQFLFDDTDIEYLRRIAVAIDPEDSEDHWRLKSYVQEIAKLPVTLKFNELTVLRDLESIIAGHRTRASKYLADDIEIRYHGGLFIDSKIEGDQKPLHRELVRQKRGHPNLISVSASVGETALKSIIDRFGEEITIVVDLFPSTQPANEVSDQSCGIPMQDLAKRKVEIAQRAGCSSIICSADIGPGIRDSDKDLIIYATGIRLDPTIPSDHRAPIAPAKALEFANVLFAGTEVTNNPIYDPVYMLYRYVVNMRNTTNLYPHPEVS